MDWVFQCNPARYDLAAELEKGTRTEDWAMNQHRSLISPGDRVFFWQTGPNARLLAVGHVGSPVYEREGSTFGRYCVDVVIDYKVLPPLTRPEALDHEVLGTFAPFRGMMGTNFPISSPGISPALDKALEGRLVSVPGDHLPSPSTENAQQVLDAAIKRARHETSMRLREHLSTMDPIGFEWLVRALLLRLGYTEVRVTKPSSDGGVDLSATLVTGGIARIRTCIQVKRQQSVGAPIVQSVRGSLAAHEAGMLVISGQFTAGAVAEANDPQKLPITLLNGEQLVQLLIDQQIGVEPVNLTYHRLKLDEISRERLEALVEEQ